MSVDSQIVKCLPEVVTMVHREVLVGCLVAGVGGYFTYRAVKHLYIRQHVSRLRSENQAALCRQTEHIRALVQQSGYSEAELSAAIRESKRLNLSVSAAAALALSSERRPMVSEFPQFPQGNSPFPQGKSDPLAFCEGAQIRPLPGPTTHGLGYIYISVGDAFPRKGDYR